MTPLLTAFAIVALALVWGVLAFNGLVRARNRVDEAWSGVDVQLKRRCDLVPNLVAAVRGYAQHEREVLEAARSIYNGNVRTLGSNLEVLTRRGRLTVAALGGQLERDRGRPVPTLRALCQRQRRSWPA